jgi:predicted nucleic acid-binding protein
MGVKALLSELCKYNAILFDTNTMIYYFEDVKPYSDILESIFSHVQSGHIHAYLSVVTAAELLVKPLREEDHGIANNYLQFYRYYPNLTVAETTRDIAIQGAVIRATTGLKMPDALIAATAAAMKCPILGNDREWTSKKLPVPYFYLKDYIITM